MSNSIRTNTSAPQTQPQQQGFFGALGRKIGQAGRALKETFATPEVPAQKPQGVDNYRPGQPLSESAKRRMQSLTAGGGTQGMNQRRTQLGANYTQADYIAMCDSIARLNENS